MRGMDDPYWKTSPNSHSTSTLIQPTKRISMDTNEKVEQYRIDRKAKKNNNSTFDVID